MQASAAAGLGAWTVDVTYDPTVVTATGCTPGAGNTVCNAGFAAHTIRITGASATGLSGGQTLATITFTGVGAKATSSSIDLAVRTLTDATGAPLAATTSAGRIHVK